MERRTQKRKPGKWIYRPTRHAIYLRDNHTCVWCGKHVSEGVELSLDHLIPWVYFGADKHTNLVTCCRKCNSKRGDKQLRSWYRVVENEFQSLEELKQTKKYIAKVRRSTTSSIKKYRNIVNGKQPQYKLAEGHSLANQQRG